MSDFAPRDSCVLTAATAVFRSVVISMMLAGGLFVTGGTAGAQGVSQNIQDSANADRIDSTTLHGKVLCGYQGWFRCQGDGTDEGWFHWSRQRDRVTPDSLTVEMWPETSEFSAEELFDVPALTDSAGRPAKLFSSVHPKTTDRHFRWMKDYGIDGIFLQRFLVTMHRPSFETVLSNVRKSAENHGRTYAICYDMTGARPNEIAGMLANDWNELSTVRKVTDDPMYLHHDGKPVVFVWGFFHDRFSAETAHGIIDVFRKSNAPGVMLVGGCEWPWRTVEDPEWARAFRRLDVISPWNVGNYELRADVRVAATHYWDKDLQETARHNIAYMPVIYPGFSWTNLQGKGSEKATIPRREGAFFREQFQAVSEHGISMAYVAMFDEVDEATAIFKVSNQPPQNAFFQTFDGLPEDTYLRLTGEGTAEIRRRAGARSSALKDRIR